VAVVTSVFLTACANDRLTETQAIERALSLTVRVDTGGHGSGVYVEPGLILTAHHVVNKQDDVTITTQGGEEFAGEVTRTNEKLDLALIRVDRDTPSANLACRTPQLGEPLMFVGHPSDWGKWFVQWAQTSSKPHHDGMWVLSGSAYPGNSGGPVFDTSGNVVGIINAVYTARVGLRGGQYSTYALMRSSAEICDWLADEPA
jgi:S1-C subfamily serine protease